jgi:subtilase family serine protease
MRCAHRDNWIPVKANFLLVLTVFAVTSLTIKGTVAESNQLTQKYKAETSRDYQIGRVPELAKGSSYLGVLAFEERLKMIITFQPGDEAGLLRLLDELYDPASPRYHQWLTPEAFGEKFGRSKAEFDYAIEWLQTSGFQIDQAWPNRLSISFSGPVDVVERTFHVEMGRFHDKSHDRIFYSNRQVPSLPPEIESITSSLLGLSDADELRLAAKLLPSILDNRERQRSSDQSFIEPQGKTTGGGNYLAPADLAGAYNYKPLADAGFRGQGQRVGIVIDSDIADSDIALYRNSYGLPAANVRRFIPPSYTYPGITQDGSVECALDVASISAVAPMAEIDIVLIPNLQLRSITDAELYIINTLGIPVINESFGGCEDVFFSASEQTLMRQAVTQGIAFFVASGDEGIECSPGQPGRAVTAWPACYDAVTAVGGTQIDGNYNSNGDLISIVLESVWNDPPGVRKACDGKTALGGGATGGGFSQKVAQPDYQTSASGFSGGVTAVSGRVVPDISALAGRPGAAFAHNNSLWLGGGTSQASPLWAGMMALINQFKGSVQGSPNRELYRLGVNQYRNGGPAVFFDIRVGNNSTESRQPCVPTGTTGVSATVGYDAVTGWGVPDLDLLARNFGVIAAGNNPPLITSLAASLKGDVLTLTGTATDLDGDIVQAQSRTFNASGGLVGQTEVFNVSLGSTSSVSFVIPLSGLNGFPTAVRASLILIDTRTNRSAEAIANFGQPDPGGPNISNAAYDADGGVLTIKGPGFGDQLQLEVNGVVVAPPPRIKIKGGGTKLKITGSLGDLNLRSAANRVVIVSGGLRSNILVVVL